MAGIYDSVTNVLILNVDICFIIIGLIKVTTNENIIYIKYKYSDDIPNFNIKYPIITDEAIIELVIN